MPKTLFGQWSSGFIILFFLFLAALRLLVASGQRGAATFFSNPVLAITRLLAGVSGVCAFIIGIITITRRNERSPLVLPGAAIGPFVLIFLLGEVLSPH